MIKMSVVMPLYRVEYIGWLAFESLVNQVGIDFDWELIILEENTGEHLGESFLRSKYYDDLHKIKCSKIVYKVLDHWISLSKKYRLLTELCNSPLWTLAVGDYYSPTTRLKTCYDSFYDIGWDFYRTSKLIFYDFVSDTWVIRRVSSRGACCKAVRMEIAKQIVYGNIRRKGLDGWFFRQCQAIKLNLHEYVEPIDYWKSGFNTHGFNNLSHDRTAKIANNFHKFLPYDVYDSKIPEDVILKLALTREYMSQHVMGDFS